MFANVSRYIRLTLSVTGLVAILALAQVTLAAPFVPARDAHCVAYSNDGSLVATGISGFSNDEFPPRPHPNPRKCGVVQVWSIESGKRIRRFETFGDLTQVAFSADNQFIAAARLHMTVDKLQLNEVRVWSIKSGKAAFVFDRCHAFSLSPQGNAIAVASQRRCVVYELATGDKLKQFPGLAGAVSLRYAPDGQQLLGVVVTEAGCELRLCNVADPSLQLSSSSFDEPFYTAKFSPDGRVLATGHARGSVLLWEANSLTPIRRLESGHRGLQHLFFSPDGSMLGTGDQTNGDILFWDLQSGQELSRYTFEKGELHTYRHRTPDERITPEKDPERFVFSPDGQSFLSAPNGGILRSVATGQDSRRFGD
jgi:WD40 repeat protein